MGRQQIRGILSALPTNQEIPVETILNHVQTSGLLSDTDLEPHTQSRPTHYPRWKAYVQAVLWDLKRKGKVIHDPDKHSYIFL